MPDRAGQVGRAVGEILSVSERSVNIHLRNGFRWLDGSSRHRALLKSMVPAVLRACIVDPGPLVSTDLTIRLISLAFARKFQWSGIAGVR